MAKRLFTILCTISLTLTVFTLNGCKKKDEVDTSKDNQITTVEEEVEVPYVLEEIVGISIRDSFNDYDTTAVTSSLGDWAVEGQCEISENSNNRLLKLMSTTNLAQTVNVTGEQVAIKLELTVDKFDNGQGVFSVNANDFAILQIKSINNKPTLLSGDDKELSTLELSKTYSVQAIFTTNSDTVEIYVNDKKTADYKMPSNFQAITNFNIANTNGEGNQIMIDNVYVTEFNPSQEFTATPPISSTYYGKIKEINDNKVVIKDYKTGYIAEYSVDEGTRVVVKKQRDIDELKEGTWIRIYPTRDDNALTMTNGDAYVEQSEPTFETPADLKSDNGMTYGQIKYIAGDYENFDGFELLTRDKKKMIKLDVGGEIYTLLYPERMRPNIFEETDGDYKDLKVDCYATVSYDGEGDNRRIASIWLEDYFPFLYPYWCNEPAGASGLSMEDINKRLSGAKSKYEEIKPIVLDNMPVDMRLTPELAKRGDEIKLTIKAYALKTPSSKAMLYKNYFENNMKEREEITLEWKETGKKQLLKNEYFTEVVLPSNKLGQHLFIWSSDIGGDISLYSRSYAVVDKSMAVFVINNLSCNAMRTVYDDKFVPYNVWEQFVTNNSINWATENNSKAWSDKSKAYRQFGLSPNFMDIYAPWGTYQVRAETKEFQKRIFEIQKDMAIMLGFREDTLNFGDYGLGQETIELARETGFKYVHSMVTNNHVDGTFGINQSGKPDRPYFLSMEDFRKPKREEKPLVALSQLQWNYPLGLRYFTHYVPGPGEYVSFNWQDVQADENPAVYYARVMDFLDGLFQNRMSQTVPFIIQMNMQFEGSHPSVNEGNQMIFDYYMEVAKRGEAVFATSNGIADYYLNHVQTQPETVMYLPDNFAGYTVYDKPGDHPDVMSMENQDLMTVNFYGGYLPDTFFDYTTKWDYPDCGNEQVPRSKSGLGMIVDEDNVYKYEIEPLIVDTRNMKVNTEYFSKTRELKIKVTVESDRDQVNLPISLWDIPREWRAVKGWWSSEGDCRFIPVRAPFTANLNGFLLANVKKGTNTFYVIINTPEVKPNSMDFIIGGAVRGKFFERKGVKAETNTYLWNAYPWENEIEITLSEGRSGSYYTSPTGEKTELVSGVNTIFVPNDQRIQIVGLTYEEFTKNSRLVTQ